MYIKRKYSSCLLRISCNSNKANRRILKLCSYEAIIFYFLRFQQAYRYFIPFPSDAASEANILQQSSQHKLALSPCPLIRSILQIHPKSVNRKKFDHTIRGCCTRVLTINMNIFRCTVSYLAKESAPKILFVGLSRFVDDDLVNLSNRCFLRTTRWHIRLCR